MITKHNKTLFALLIIGWLYIILEYAVRVSDSVIIDHLIHALATSAAGIGTLSSAYYFTYVAFQTPCGIAIDKFGLVKCWFIGIITVAFGCLLFSQSHSLLSASIARIFMGFGSAFAWIGILKLIYQQSQFSKYRTLLIGFSMSIAMLGAIIGQAPWVALVNLSHSWRLPYVYSAVLGLLLAFSLFFIKQTQHTTALQTSPSWQGIKRLLQDKSFWILACYMAVLSSPQTTFSALWGVKYFSVYHHFTAVKAASLISLIWVGALFGGPVLGLAYDYSKHPKRLLIILSSVTASCMLAVLYLNLPTILLAALLLIIGLLSNGSVVIFSMVAKGYQYLPTATNMGVLNSINIGGGACLQFIIGISISAFMHFQSQYHSYTIAMAIIPVLLAIVTIMIYLFHDKVSKVN